MAVSSTSALAREAIFVGSINPGKSVAPPIAQEDISMAFSGEVAPLGSAWNSGTWNVSAEVAEMRKEAAGLDPVAPTGSAWNSGTWNVSAEVAEMRKEATDFGLD
jgi:hypothetical protein